MSRSIPPDRYRFVVAALVMLAHFAAGVNFQAVSPVLPLISEDYQIGHATSGLLVGGATLVFAGLGIPGAMIVGWLGL